MRGAIVVALVLVAARVARAEEIVLVSDDPAFRTALADTVASAGLTVKVATDAAPALAEITRASREIADREHAASTVWLLAADGNATLIAYDRAVDRMLVRSLPYAGPLTAVQAAEAARTTRTMLRALRVPDDDTPPPPRPRVAVTPRAPQVVVARPSPAVRFPDTLAIDADGGVRVRGPGSDAAFAGTLGVIWRPDRVGIAVAARLAPAVDVDAVMGRISDNSIAASVRMPLSAASRIAVIPSAGVALHRIALDGTFDGNAVRDRRYDPALRIGISGTYAITPTIGLGLSMSADGLLRRQTYETTSAVLVDVPRIQAVAGVIVVARIL